MRFYDFQLTMRITKHKVKTIKIKNKSNIQNNIVLMRETKFFLNSKNIACVIIR